MTVRFFRRPKILTTLILTLLLIGGGLFWYRTAFGVVRTWDGGGADGTCGGGAGDGNKWTCALNWTGDTVPTSADTVVFDGTSTKNATINSSLSGGSAPAGISINAGYTGTITQASGVTINIGSSGFSQAAGTFTGGNSAITINSGSFTLSGGTFTSTSGTFTLVGNFTHTAGGTFNHNNGTFDFGGGSAASFTINVATNETFNNLTANVVCCSTAITISSGDTLIVLGTFTHTGNSELNTGTVEARGNIVVGAGSWGGTGTLSLPAAGDQTITGSGGRVANLNIAKPSGTVTASGTVGAQSFTLSGGTFTSTTGTFYIMGSFTHTAGGTFNHNNGTVEFGYGVAVSPTIDVATSETFYNLTTSPVCCSQDVNIGVGDTLIVLGTFTQTNSSRINTGTVEARGNVVLSAATNGGGDGTLSLLVAGDQTITGSGSGYGPNLNIAKASGTVRMVGSISVASFTLSGGTFNASTGTLSTRGNFTHTAGGTFNHGNGTVNLGDSLPTNPTLNVATSETFYNLTISPTCCSQTATISAGDTAIVLGTFTHTGSSVINTGTIEARGNVVIAGGASGGSALLSFTGSGDQTYTDSGGNEPDGNITINKPVGTKVTLLSNADWNAASQALTITSGILDISSYTLYTGGTLTIGANGVLHDYSTGDLVLGGNVSNSGIIRLESSGTCGYTDAISVTSSDVTQRQWIGFGVFTLWDVSLQNQGGTAKIQVHSGTSVSGNGTNFVFNSACNFTNNTSSLTSGLTGYWPTEENSGTSTADMGGNANTGTLARAAMWTTGNIGYGLQYDANSSDTVSIANESSFDYNQQYFTVACWFNSSLVSNGILMAKGGNDDGGWNLVLNADGTVGMNLKNGTGTSTQVRLSASGFNDGRWHHVAAVVYFDTVTAGNNAISLYLDGVLNQGSLTGSGTTPTLNNYNLRIGARQGTLGTITHYTGLIDEARIYNRALTSTEVQQLYYNVRPSATGIPAGKFNITGGKMRIQ